MRPPPNNTTDCVLEGNVQADELPHHGSVGFVIVDGEYQFLRRPGMEDTSVSYIDASCERAYGWSRDKPWDDPTARENSWVLDLKTMEFSDLVVPGTTKTIVRNGHGDRVVGKAWVDAGTPDDPTDDERRGFIYNVATGEAELIERDGFSDIGFTALNDETVVGFNDFGAQGFMFRSQAFIDLNHDDAFRLFPFQINSSGVIVGMWGLDADTWWDNALNPAFVGRPTDEGYNVEPFKLDGYVGTSLTGLNDAGAIAGIAYESATSVPRMFTAASVDSAPVFHALASHLEPFPTSLTDRGWVLGQTFILSSPICGGHGTLEGDTCICDAGFKVDPVDAANCLSLDAECNGHGHLHGDACHCDAGFVQDSQDQSRCVPVVLNVPKGRLLVSDGSQGRVVVVDLELGEGISTLSLAGASRVYPSSDGAAAFAVQTGADGVQGLDPGLAWVSHGDHYDRVQTSPEVHDEPVVSCTRPIHFVAHDDHAATFCDGDGMLHVFDDTVSPQSFTVATYDSGRAHHGVGLVAFGGVLLSLPNAQDEEDALPVGVRALTHDGFQEAVFDTCPSLHGEAATADHVCFGCGDGVLCVTRDSEGTLTSVKIPNPSGAPAGTRVGRLAASHDLMIGNWGDELVVIDPFQGVLSPVVVGEPYLTFSLTHDGAHVVVLTDSGALLKIRLSDGTLAKTLPLLEPIVREPGHGQLLPTLLLADDFAYVVDPRRSTLHEVELAGLQLTGRIIELGGGEFHSLALVAVPPDHDH